MSGNIGPQGLFHRDRLASEARPRLLQRRGCLLARSVEKAAARGLGLGTRLGGFGGASRPNLSHFVLVAHCELSCLIVEASGFVARAVDRTIPFDQQP